MKPMNVISGSRHEYLMFLQESGLRESQARHLTRPADLLGLNGALVLTGDYSASPAYNEGVISDMSKTGKIHLSHYAIRLV